MRIDVKGHFHSYFPSNLTWLKGLIRGDQDRQPSISGEDGLGDNGDEHGHRGDQGPAEWEPCQPGVLLKGHEQQAEGRFEFQNTPNLFLGDGTGAGRATGQTLGS